MAHIIHTQLHTCLAKKPTFYINLHPRFTRLSSSSPNITAVICGGDDGLYSSIVAASSINTVAYCLLSATTITTTTPICIYSEREGQEGKPHQTKAKAQQHT